MRGVFASEHDSIRATASHIVDQEQREGLGLWSARPDLDTVVAEWVARNRVDRVWIERHPVHSVARKGFLATYDLLTGVLRGSDGQRINDPRLDANA